MTNPQKTVAPETSEMFTNVHVEVYDPVMCCSSGVCGPDVDEAVLNFASDVKWLKNRGASVTRHNLGQEPQAFKSNPAVLSRLQAEGTGCLPIVEVNGKTIAEGRYPSREELGKFAGLSH
ncbi:MAG: arsenite efflux transporter metallochaperone ArsD [Cyclonatronaceae bacterium]